MPYIPIERKMELSIRQPETVGELTYCIQQLIDGYLKKRGEAMCFDDLAHVLGALEAAKIDFVEHVMQDYEYKKRRQNGDVWSPEVIKRVLM